MRWLWLLLAFMLVNACTTVPLTGPVIDHQVMFEERARLIEAVPDWSLVGRISLDDGEEGGSGRLQWVVKPDQSTMDFHGAMGRGAWHLEIKPGGAVLRLANGKQFVAEGVDALVEQQVGWPIPVEALQWWVRGLAAPGSIDSQQLDETGLLISLTQFGWQIEFNRYASDSGVALPVRLDARRNDYRVKLAISRWHLPGNDTSAN